MQIAKKLTKLLRNACRSESLLLANAFSSLLLFACRSSINQEHINGHLPYRGRSSKGFFCFEGVEGKRKEEAIGPPTIF